MKRQHLLLPIIALLLGCQSKKTELPLLNPESFKTTVNGKEIKLYTIKNKKGLTAQITNLGGRIVSIWAPDKEGNYADVCLGFKTAKEYLESNGKFYGATIGRYANRIAKGQFIVNKDTFNLTCNNGPNALHGGPTGYYYRIWEAIQNESNKLTLSYHSQDGEEGYPGNLDIRITFEITDKNSLQIEYYASTDKTTPINLTNHTFFNLAGEGSGTINNHLLYINADNFTPVDSTLIPTGEISPVTNTPMDFRFPTPIGDRVEIPFKQLVYGKGYDHNWVLNTTAGGITHAATLEEPASGRIMHVYTNEPGLQFYGGNFMNGSDTGKFGKTFKYREALCLETQHYPDSPNQPNFPSTLLEPGKKYRSTCIYQFKTK